MRNSHRLVSLSALFVFSVALTTGQTGGAPGDIAGGPRTLRVAGIMGNQIRDGDYRAHNYREAERMIRAAAQAGAELVCTSEQFLDGYGFDANKIEHLESEHVARCEVIGESVYIKRLASLAGELRIVIVAGLAIRDSTGTYNSALVFGPRGELLGQYRKTHNMGRYAAWFAPLTQAEKREHCRSFDVGKGRVSVKICNDRHFSETTRFMIENECELIVCPAFGQYDPSRLVDDAREFGLWCVFVHADGCQFINENGVLLEKKKTKGISSFALGEVELRSPRRPGRG